MTSAKMAAVNIKHRHTCAVLYAHQASNERIASGLAVRDALEAATNDRADLAGADLAHANLAGANLAHANLASADLAGADLAHANLAGADLAGEKLVGNRPIMMIGPIGSRAAYLCAYVTNFGVMVRAGCFYGTRAEFAAAVDKTHGNNEHAKEYAAALALIDAHAALWAAQPSKVTESA